MVHNHFRASPVRLPEELLERPMPEKPGAYVKTFDAPGTCPSSGLALSGVHVVDNGAPPRLTFRVFEFWDAGGLALSIIFFKLRLRCALGEVVWIDLRFAIESPTKIVAVHERSKPRVLIDAPRKPPLFIHAVFGRIATW